MGNEQPHEEGPSKIGSSQESARPDRFKAPRGRLEDGSPNPVDTHVGARIRQRRTLLGMSQATLGEVLGLTFQQVQKYERGANRIGASRLFRMARALDVPISYFYDAMAEDVERSSPARIARGGASFLVPNKEWSVLARRESIELVRAYYGISDTQSRNVIYNLIKDLARASEAETRGDEVAPPVEPYVQAGPPVPVPVDAVGQAAGVDAEEIVERIDFAANSVAVAKVMAIRLAAARLGVAVYPGDRWVSEGGDAKTLARAAYRGKQKRVGDLVIRVGGDAANHCWVGWRPKP